MNPKFQQAVSAVRSGQHKEAQYLLTQLLKDDPGDAQAWFLLSQLVDSDQRRLSYLKRVIALEPDHELALQQLAEAEAVEPKSVAEHAEEVIPEAIVEEVIAAEDEVMADIVVGPAQEAATVEPEEEEPDEELVEGLADVIEAPVVSVPEAPPPQVTLTEMLEPGGEQLAASAPAESTTEEPTMAEVAPIASPSTAVLDGQRAQERFLTRTLYVLVGLAIIVAVLLLLVIFAAL
jgi:hypothetical protein